jgi:hypothetical protein
MNNSFPDIKVIGRMDYNEAIQKLKEVGETDLLTATLPIH